MAQSNQPNIQQRAYGIAHFTIVQLIALVGWIIVQSLFSLSPFGRSLPFALMIIVEAIWWIATLLIMFYLFRRIYNSFVQAVLDLEDANKRLRSTTNSFLFQKKDQEPPKDQEPSKDQEPPKDQETREE